MESHPQTRATRRFTFSPLRILLSGYFLAVAAVIAVGLAPLPEEPPRVQFVGLTMVVAGTLLGFFWLTSRYRLFLVGALVYLPVAAQYMLQHIKNMEMLLQDTLLERITLYTMPLVLVSLLAPRMWREFDRSVRAYQPINQSDGRRGIPF